MRHLALTLALLLALGTGLVTGLLIGQPTPAPTMPTATSLHMGQCWVSGPYAACAPMFSPDGYPVGTVWEDGFAEYPGSIWFFDPGQQRFMPDTSPVLPLYYA